MGTRTAEVDVGFLAGVVPRVVDVFVRTTTEADAHAVLALMGRWLSRVEYLVLEDGTMGEGSHSRGGCGLAGG